MKKYSLYLMGFLLFAISCDEICTHIPPPVIVEDDRVIMIEELTGVNCTPCAAAAAILEDIIENADGAVVAYGIHGLRQSEPIEGSKYDFRNEDAEELESYLIDLGKPAASFNRTEESPTTGSLVHGPTVWQAIVDQELIKPQVADVKITSNYDTDSRRVDITVDVTSLENITGEINLVVAISESDLIDPQSSPDGNILDFKHKHVLKELLTPILGIPISNDGLMIGDPVDSRFSYTIPAELNGEWIPENMEITAFITADDRNGEIQQAAQIHLTE